MAVKSHNSPSWRCWRLSLVGQQGLSDGGNAEIDAVKEIQQFRDLAADYVRVPLHHS